VNKKQKVLTIVMLPVFLLTGLFFLGPPFGGFASAFTAWFAVGVVYAGLFFILRPSKPN
jgi:hypothetical protein